MKCERHSKHGRVSCTVWCVCQAGPGACLSRCCPILPFPRLPSYYLVPSYRYQQIANSPALPFLDIRCASGGVPRVSAALEFMLSQLYSLDIIRPFPVIASRGESRYLTSRIAFEQGLNLQYLGSHTRFEAYTIVHTYLPRYSVSRSRYPSHHQWH